VSQRGWVGAQGATQRCTQHEQCGEIPGRPRGTVSPPWISITARATAWQSSSGRCPYRPWSGRRAGSMRPAGTHFTSCGIARSCWLCATTDRSIPRGSAASTASTRSEKLGAITAMASCLLQFSPCAVSSVKTPETREDPTVTRWVRFFSSLPALRGASSRTTQASWASPFTTRHSSTAGSRHGYEPRRGIAPAVISFSRAVSVSCREPACQAFPPRNS